MGTVENLAQSGNNALVEATLVSNQENGIVCYATGYLSYTPALVQQGPVSPGQTSSSPAALDTGAFDPFRGGGPLPCYFSNMMGVPGGTPLVPQPFDASEVQPLQLRISGFDGSSLATAARLVLSERRPVNLSLQRQGDLFTGSGRSIVDGTVATYTLALVGIKFK